MSGNSVPSTYVPPPGKSGPWNPRTEWQLHENTRLNPIHHKKGPIALLFDRIHRMRWLKSTPALFVGNMALITFFVYYFTRFLHRSLTRMECHPNLSTQPNMTHRKAGVETPMQSYNHWWSTVDRHSRLSTHVDKTSMNIPTEAIREGYTYTYHYPQQVSVWLPFVNRSRLPERFVTWYKNGEEVPPPPGGDKYLGFWWNPIRNYLYSADGGKAAKEVVR